MMHAYGKSYICMTPLPTYGAYYFCVIVVRDGRWRDLKTCLGLVPDHGGF